MRLPYKQARLNGLTLPGVGEVITTGGLISGIVGLAFGIWFARKIMK